MGRAKLVLAALALVALLGGVAACNASGSSSGSGLRAGDDTGAAIAKAVGDSQAPPPSPTSSTKAPKPVLYGGEKLTAVEELQRVLRFRGYEVPLDGTYGPDTMDAIKGYQVINGLPNDGVVDDATWFALAFPHPLTTTTPPPTTAAPTTTRPPVLLPSGPVNHAVVRLATQQLELYDGFVLKGRIPISSGANGATPRGSFQVFRKVPRATADSDPLVTMPWMTNFNGGIGFHGIPVRGTVPLPTPLGQYPVSHGCIRMADAHAKWLYDNLGYGAVVDVV